MRLCKVENCSRRHHSHGYCHMHAYRFRKNGTPDLLVTPPGAPTQFLHEAASSEISDCIVWPYGRKGAGYPAVHVGSKMLGAHAVACEQRHGPAPVGHQAAHNCGNRLCVNGSHLRWATPKENNADKPRHGTDNNGERHGLACLTNAQAAEARKMLGSGVRQADVARSFNVSRMVVSNIARGVTYKEVGP